MGYRNITRDELENLYSHEGLTRKELRYLLRINPNQISDKLADVFRTKMNPFKLKYQQQFTIRGFLHAPPKKIMELFNSIHYQIISELGQYSLFILSSSPNDTNIAVPVIIPTDTIAKSEITRAHFAAVTGTNADFKQFENKKLDGIFVVASEVNVLGFSELFDTTDPTLKNNDLFEMINDRFNTPKLESTSIFLWLMSSPKYESRAGGNSYSPISPTDEKFKCEKTLLDNFQKNLLSIPLPYFTKSTSRTSVFDYFSPTKMKLSYYQDPEIGYKYEKNLKNAVTFLKNRTPITKFPNQEINISTTALELNTLVKRPLESFIHKPVMPAEMLTLTDMPMVFTNNDLVIEEKENEIFDYSMEISQLIYQSRLKVPHSQFDFLDTSGAVKDVVDNKMKSFPELRELMLYGIVFDLNPIGGLGEHLTRISNSILRTDNSQSKTIAMIKSEEFFVEIITKLFDELDKPVKDLYYNLEETRAERDQIKSNRIRNIINSILFGLNNTFKDGWKYKEFEVEFKKRSGYGAKKTNDIFQKLLEQKEVSERSPGLYWHIIGFDRYF
jgi:hypothetical protein